MDIVPETLGRGAAEAGIPRHSGIVDQDVDGADAGGAFRKGGSDGTRVADVDDGGFDPDTVCAQLFGEGGHRVALVERDDGRTLSAEIFAQLSADAA